jgi:hypothetical protein
MWQGIIFLSRYLFHTKALLNFEIPALCIHYIFLAVMAMYWWIKKDNPKAAGYTITMAIILVIGFGSCTFLVMDNLHG